MVEGGGLVGFGNLFKEREDRKEKRQNDKTIKRKKVKVKECYRGEILGIFHILSFSIAQLASLPAMADILEIVVIVP